MGMSSGAYELNHESARTRMSTYSLFCEKNKGTGNYIYIYIYIGMYI